jgi:hypothetical protein
VEKQGGEEERRERTSLLSSFPPCFTLRLDGSVAPLIEIGAR